MKDVRISKYRKSPCKSGREGIEGMLNIVQGENEVDWVAYFAPDWTGSPCPMRLKS